MNAWRQGRWRITKFRESRKLKVEIMEREPEMDSTRPLAYLNRLLARIHQDGGHYTANHGLDKSVEDADRKVVEAYAQLEVNRPCKWSETEGGHDTGCGQTFLFTTDGVKENGFRFCPYCGKAIAE